MRRCNYVRISVVDKWEGRQHFQGRGTEGDWKSTRLLYNERRLIQRFECRASEMQV